MSLKRTAVCIGTGIRGNRNDAGWRDSSVFLLMAVIEYFKDVARQIGIPYQNLINLYLRTCVHAGKTPALSWTAGS